MNDTVELTIFHTNDIHGHIENLTRLAHLAGRLKDEAEAQGRVVLFWDAGDAADRRIRICALTKGAAMYDLLRAAGYQLQTMGNAIAPTYGPQAMAECAHRAGFPILAANLVDESGRLVDGLQASMLIDLPRGLKLGVFGLTVNMNNVYGLFGLAPLDPVAAARQSVQRLRDQEAQLVVLLSHLGLRDDQELLRATPGIDLVIGGHSHSELPEGEQQDGVLIAQAGSFARFLGRVDLSLEASSGRVIRRSARLIEVPEDEPPAQAVQDAIATAEAEADSLVARPVGWLEDAFALDHFAECAIGDLAADALRERMGAEIGLVAGGMFHAGLPAGELTYGRIVAACFSTANPAVTEVSGAQILEALERGLDPQVYAGSFSGMRGNPLGKPQISGMKVVYNPQGKTGKRVHQAWVNGEPLDLERRYRLAHTDLETYQNCYLRLEPGQEPAYEMPTIMTDVLEEHIQKNGRLGLPQNGRWVEDLSGF